MPTPELFEIKCKGCAGALDYVEGQKIVYCKYCGAQHRFDDNKKEYVIADVAKIQKLTLANEIRDYDEQRENARIAELDSEKEKKKRWTIAVIIAHFIMPIYAILRQLVKIPNAISTSGILVDILLFVYLILPIILAATKPQSSSKHGKLFYMILLYITMWTSVFAVLTFVNHIMDTL